MNVKSVSLFYLDCICIFIDSKEILQYAPDPAGNSMEMQAKCAFTPAPEGNLRETRLYQHLRQFGEQNV